MEMISEMKNILSVQIIYPETTLRVIVSHGPQEDDNIEERRSFFENLQVEIERGRTSEEIPIVLGDLNAKLSGTINEPTAISGNGKLLTDLLHESQMKVTNFHKKTEGKWTRIQTSKKGTTKSTLDYILVDEQLIPLVQEMVIDEEKAFTPFRITKPRGQQKITFTDHSAMLIKFNCTKGKVTSKPPKRKVWNFTEGGFEIFRERTSQPFTLDTTESSENMYKNWTDQLLTILADCFQKKTIGGNPKVPKISMARRNVRKILQIFAKRGKVQRALVKEYLKYLYSIEVVKIEAKRAEKLIKTAEMLTEEEKFSPNGYWKLKKSVSRKTQSKITSVISNNVEVSE